MIRVYADVVADLFHYGHAGFFQQARALGDQLVVGVHSDEDVSTYKPTPVLSADERARVVRACRWVDEVLLDAPLRVTHELIDRHAIDLVVHGDDMDLDALADWYAVPMELGIFRTLPYTKGISTSDIVDRIARRGAGR